MAHINKATTWGNAPGSAAFELVCPQPVTLTLTEPIMDVGKPAAVTRL
jgi:hypothetical protein